MVMYHGTIRKKSPKTNPSLRITPLYITPHQQIAAPGYHRVASNKTVLLYQPDRSVLVLPEYLN